MQAFPRDRIHTHCIGAEWPDFLGKVELGESFLIRNCALYGLGNFVQKEGKTERPDRDIALVGVLPKHVFG